MYAWALRPLLFLLPPDTAHQLAFAGMAPLEYLAPLRALTRALLAPHDPRIAVSAMGLAFPSPLGLAGGFDKNGLRPRALAALGFGHLELGTVTALAQEANPPPNMFRLPRDRALVNRLGFPNEGAEPVAARIRARRSVGIPLGISIGKSRAVPVDDLDAVNLDYLAALARVAPVADFVVVNVSSPNTAGLRGLQGAGAASMLLARLATARQGKPMLLKIAPDLDDAQLEGLLSIVDETKLDGVIATNTTISRTGLATDEQTVEAVGAGGLSGAPLRARALEVVKRVRARLGPKPVVVGVGGVERAEHALALVRAGADLVQMYTGFIYEGPGAPSRIARDLGALVTREGATTLSELRG